MGEIWWSPETCLVGRFAVTETLFITSQSFSEISFLFTVDVLFVRFLLPFVRWRFFLGIMEQERQRNRERDDLFSWHAFCRFVFLVRADLNGGESWEKLILFSSLNFFYVHIFFLRQLHDELILQQIVSFALCKSIREVCQTWKVSNGFFFYKIKQFQLTFDDISLFVLGEFLSLHEKNSVGGKWNVYF